MIEVRALSARIGGIPIIEDVSLTVPAGASFGIVGESGSGKSTLLRIIAGLNEDWTGELVVAGAAMGRRRSPAERRRVQMVFQDPYGSLHPRHTVHRALAEPLAIHRIGDVEARVAAALAAVSLEPRHRFRYPHQLSGGQRQRVAIARALILEPPLLLLDEPTAALDATIEAEILGLLERLRRTRGITYLLVSHDLRVVTRLCERVAVMRRGRLVEELSAAALAAGEARHPYTRELLRASRGFRRQS